MDDDRGQLMLVGAVTIAVIFLGLVAVLNTGLFASNVAPRGGLSTAADAETFVDGIGQDAPILLGSAAEDAVDGEVYAFESVLNDEIERYESYLLRSVGSERAATVGVALNGTVTGTGGLVVDDDPNTGFDSADDDDEDWEIATDVSEIGGRLTVYQFPVHNATGDETFALEAADRLFSGADAWRLELYWDESENEAHVRSVDDDGVLADCVLPQRQAYNASGVTIDLTNGRVVGTGCTFPTVDDSGALNDPVSTPYDLGIERGGLFEDSRAVGTYAIAVDGDIDDNNVVDGRPNVSTAPYSVPRIDAASLDARYTSPSLSYETVLRVEPAVVDLPPPPLTGRGLVFVNDSTPGRLRSLGRNNGPVQNYDVTDAQVTGPAALDFDADGRVEVPYVDSSGAVRLVDGRNESSALTADSRAVASKSRLSVGTWNGSPVSVFYAGSNTNYVYGITPGGSPVAVVNATVQGNGASAAVGPADIDGDGTREFVYVDSSQQLRYLDNGVPELKINGGGVGASTGIGIGPAHDFDGDGVERIPFVDGSSNLRLVGAAGNPETLVGGVDAAPLAVRDVNGDGDAEIVYLKNSEVFFLDGVGTGTTVERQLQRRAQGNTTTVTVSKGQGVA